MFSGFKAHTRANGRANGSLWLRALLALTIATGGIVGGAATASARLQCVTYARDVTGMDLHGNARTWWAEAEGRYERGAQPAVGAIMAMAASRAMPYGHVAVVDRVIDARHILVEHANWSGPGAIDRHVLVEDASVAGDWSVVRVARRGGAELGIRTNALNGFIYAHTPAAAPMVTEAVAVADPVAAGMM